MAKKYSLAKKVGIGSFLLAFLSNVIAFVTDYWLEVDPLNYNTGFKNLGLWQHCFT